MGAVSGIGEQYECEVCHGVFEKGWSDEEAFAETAAMWEPIPGDDVGVVCDGCFREVVAWYRQEDPGVFRDSARGPG
jgi:rubredoxin